MCKYCVDMKLVYVTWQLISPNVQSPCSQSAANSTPSLSLQAIDEDNLHSKVGLGRLGLLSRVTYSWLGNKITVDIEILFEVTFLYKIYLSVFKLFTHG